MTREQFLRALALEWLADDRAAQARIGRAIEIRDAERERLRLPETTFRPRQGPIPGFRSHHVRGGGS